LGVIARHWFEVMRECGDDVRELLHDGHPTACIGDAAFGYVNAFTAHVNVGFFRDAEMEDPESLLEGTGKFMRHVKLRRNACSSAGRTLEDNEKTFGIVIFQAEPPDGAREFMALDPRVVAGVMTLELHPYRVAV
jgi:hypothetical protein